MAYRIGIDSGGTFTDAVLLNAETGELNIAKTPSTPDNPSIGVYNGIEKILGLENISLDQISSLIHGTTVATNAILEYKGSRTALVLTQGFIDILSILRQDRPRMYDYFKQRPTPLVPRNLRFEVPERMLSTGEVLTPLDENSVINVINKIRSMGIGTIAVCLLHSYINPDHEKKIGDLIKTHYPQARVSLSSEILPEIREYERMSTTVINAYVMPKMERYLKDLSSKITKNGNGETLTINVMQSNGGILRSEAAQKRSVATILSGPAGGVIGSQLIARNAGFQNVITIDVGGTSADICMIADGSYLTAGENQLGGHALKVPMIDINTIGAGGGSIAWLDDGGLLRVGPQSAGADPGPACYGKGGDKPTVTDANLVLGRINPDFYVGGEMALDIQRSKAAIKNQIAIPSGMSLEQAAEGIIRVVNANMMRGIRVVSVERGHDPRDFSLFAFGGGGALHAVDLALELKIPQVIVPRLPGVNSAVGLLVADFRYDYSRTYLVKFKDIDPTRINRLYSEMEHQAQDEMAQSKLKQNDFHFVRSMDLRYYGQGYEIEVPLPAKDITPEAIRSAEKMFDRMHAKLYGFCRPDEEKQIVYLRLSAFGRVKKPEFFSQKATTQSIPLADSFKQVFLNGKFLRTALYKRSDLKPGDFIEGPAIIQQMDTTTLIREGHGGRVNEFFDIVISHL